VRTIPDPPPVTIVGAGITGLACAHALRDVAEVTVVDRIPVPGGVHGWEAAETRELAQACGARMRLGETAVRWDGRVLLVIGQDGPQHLTAAALVIATGARPLGRAELGIAGGRPAGIVPATVACHLAENGLLVGRRPLIVGGGDWAMRAASELRAAGAERATLVCPDGLLRDRPADDAVHVREHDHVVSVAGTPRVRTATLASGETLGCDAVVLAHGVAALRNVDGAVWTGRRTVYSQPLDDPATVEQARLAGAEAAAAIRSLIDQEERQ
jgi:D-hydroxyproline dehydrogenase subunit alpha